MRGGASLLLILLPPAAFSFAPFPPAEGQVCETAANFQYYPKQLYISPCFGNGVKGKDLLNG
jgi:hypothetical protein